MEGVATFYSIEPPICGDASLLGHFCPAQGSQIVYNLADAPSGGRSGAGHNNLRRAKDLADPPQSQAFFPDGGQRGTDVDLLIREKNVQEASDILSATVNRSADILSFEHNAIRARFHLDAPHLR